LRVSGEGALFTTCAAGVIKEWRVAPGGDEFAPNASWLTFVREVGTAPPGSSYGCIICTPTHVYVGGSSDGMVRQISRSCQRQDKEATGTFLAGAQGEVPSCNDDRIVHLAATQHPQGELLVCVARSGRVVTVDTDGMALVDVVLPPLWAPGGITAAAVAHGKLYAAIGNGEVHEVGVRPNCGKNGGGGGGNLGERERVFAGDHGHHASISCLLVEHGRLYSASAVDGVKEWSLATGKCAGSLTPAEDNCPRVTAMCVMPPVSSGGMALYLGSLMGQLCEYQQFSRTLGGQVCRTRSYVYGRGDSTRMSRDWMSPTSGGPASPQPVGCF